MPIYIYKCDKCVLEIEKIQGINDNAPNCPKCGVSMTRKITCPAIYKVGGSARRKWCQNWTPDSKPFNKGQGR